MKIKGCKECYEGGQEVGGKKNVGMRSGGRKGDRRKRGITGMIR